MRFNILKNFGGFYSDLNYIIVESPEKYMKTFDFLVHSDRGSIFVDVYMIASIPHHPILEEACMRVLKNFIDPPYYVALASNSSMHIQDYIGIMTYLPFNFAFFRNVNIQTSDMVFPLTIKNKYPVNAKQPSFFDDYEENIGFQGIGMCNNDEQSCREEEMNQLIQKYDDNEICVENILGFDGRDGNSWFEGSALYYD